MHVDNQWPEGPVALGRLQAPTPTRLTAHLPLSVFLQQRAQEANVDSPGLDDFAHMGLITDLLE